MTWMKNLWLKIPERTRAYLLRVAEWAFVAVLASLASKWLRINIEREPFPVYVEIPAPQPVAKPSPDPLSMGWIAPTPEEQAQALAVIKAAQAGLDPDFSKLAKAAIEAADADDPVFMWEAETRVLKKLLPVWNQGSIGSCVSHGVGRACQDLILIQIASGAREKWPGAEVAREPIYGGSRVEIGGSRIRGDGSINAWAVAWLQKYGALFYQKYPTVDLSNGYNVSRCREYGQRGCPDDLEATAREHSIRTAALVKSASEVWVAIGNGYPVCIASNVGFQSPLKDGFCARRGSWAHSMCVRARFVHPTKGKCFVIQNSWGDYLSSKQWEQELIDSGIDAAEAQAKTGENDMIEVVGRGKVQLPPGCFACTSADMDVIAKQADSFALSGFVGFPRRRIDWPAMRLRERDHFARVNEPEFALAP